MAPRMEMRWDGDRLKIGNRLSGYSIVADEKYPNMWQVCRPDGSLSDIVNRARVKDAAMATLDGDLREPKRTSNAS